MDTNTDVIGVSICNRKCSCDSRLLAAHPSSTTMRSIVATALLSLVPLLTQAATYTSQNGAYQGPVLAEFESGSSGALDGQKVTPYANATSYDWYAHDHGQKRVKHNTRTAHTQLTLIPRWYFDVVAPTPSNLSMTIIFFISGTGGFPLSLPNPLSIALLGSYADGTSFVKYIPVGLGENATVTTDQDGASGVWGKTGFSFEGAPDLSQYSITLDNEAWGVSGTMNFTSVSY
jgi:hypothetical protein